MNQRIVATLVRAWTCHQLTVRPRIHILGYEVHGPISRPTVWTFSLPLSRIAVLVLGRSSSLSKGGGIEHENDRERVDGPGISCPV